MEDSDLKLLLIKDSETPKPEVNKKHLRLYGHHLCPFTEKVRLALSARNVQIQEVDVNLQHKTQWHIDINGGTVPFLEFPDGTDLIESKVLMEYAEEAYTEQGYSVLPKDPLTRAKMRIAFAVNDQLFSAVMALYMKKAYDEDLVNTLRQKLHALEDLIKKHGNEQSPFSFGSENPSQLDLHLLPTLERLAYIEGSAYNYLWEHVKFNEFPHCVKLLESMLARPELKHALVSKQALHTYLSELHKLESGQKLSYWVPIDRE